MFKTIEVFIETGSFMENKLFILLNFAKIKCYSC